MEAELKEVKTILRSLVVSSPVQVDMRALLRDYKNMIGAPLPYMKYGYRDPLAFLKERCSDCFHFAGPPANPSLILIVPNSIKHIDKLVQKQKISTPAKHIKGKRISVPESVKTTGDEQPRDMIYQSFPNKNIPKPMKYTTWDKRPPDSNKNLPNSTETKRNQINSNGTNISPCKKSLQTDVSKTETVKDVPKSDVNANSEPETKLTNTFLRKRLSSYSSQQQNSEVSSDRGSSRDEHDSGRQTSSSNSSFKKVQLEELKNEIHYLIKEHKNGILSTDLMGLYRERYGRPLEPSRGGYKDLNGVLGTLVGRVAFRASGGRVRLYDAECGGGGGVTGAGPSVAVTRRAPPPRWDPEVAADQGDALPGVAYDPDVFPADCMDFNESIPRLGVDDIRVGDMLEVIVGEVYSPTHFWLMRLGDQYNVALDTMMDDMTEYYTSGEGRSRRLSRGAVRRGQYCSSVFESDWHRSIIVNVLDSDTVKVRQVDYGTVDTVSVCSLKPLVRRWAALPAQAVRARLAGLRPGAGARRWPHAAAHAFLHRIRDKRLVANVAAVDHEESTLEVFLIDTSGLEDVCITRELIRAGHADPRPDSALTAESRDGYLYPRFEALENGDTPNFGEIARYIRDDIALEYVDAYRRHVLEPHASPPPPAASPDPVLRASAPEFHPAAWPEHSAPPTLEDSSNVSVPRLSDPQQWLRAELNIDQQQSEESNACQSPPSRPARHYGAFNPRRYSTLRLLQDSDPRHTTPDRNPATPDRSYPPGFEHLHAGSSSQSSPLGQHYTGFNRQHSTPERYVGTDLQYSPPIQRNPSSNPQIHPHVQPQHTGSMIFISPDQQSCPRLSSPGLQYSGSNPQHSAHPQQYTGSIPQNHPLISQYTGPVHDISPRQHHAAYPQPSQPNQQYSGPNVHHKPPIQHYTNPPSQQYGGSISPHAVDQQYLGSNAQLNPSEQWGLCEYNGCTPWLAQQMSELLSHDEYRMLLSLVAMDPAAARCFMMSAFKKAVTNQSAASLGFDPLHNQQ